MELNIKEFAIPEAIEFNFEELKSEIAKKMEHYQNLIYTDEQITEAKADRARLRKFVEALDSRRKEIKAEIMQPYTAFETKLNEIKNLFSEPIALIDNQIKGYEELQRKTKEESIRQTFTNMGAPAGFTVEKIWNPKWLNVTYSMKQITEDIRNHIEKFNSEMAVIERLDSYQFEAKEAYLNTLDLGAAISYADDLKEQAKRKAEYEAAQETAKRERQEQQRAELEEQETSASYQQEELKWVETKVDRQWVKFEAYLSTIEAEALAAYFDMNGIAFRPIQ